MKVLTDDCFEIIDKAAIIDAHHTYLIINYLSNLFFAIQESVQMKFL